MRQRVFIWLMLLLGGLSPTTRASHIVGAELGYRCLDPSIYEVTPTLYRDCVIGKVGFDPVAPIAGWRRDSPWPTAGF